MGHHYLPRRLLKNFSSGDLIWMFDKAGLQQPKLLPVAKVAQEPGMYTKKIEDRLNNEIEQPFNRILEEIDRGRRILAEDREVIAKYVVTSIRRVPNGRERSNDAFPSVIKAVRGETLAGIDLLEQLDPEASELAAKGRKNIGDIFQRLGSTDGGWLWNDTLMPENFRRLVPLLSGMSWRIATAPPGRQIVIGDAPVIFDEYMGLADVRAVLTFPIASNTVLIAGHDKNLNGTHHKLSVQDVRRINAEMAKKAMRWVFARWDEKWIRTSLQKGAVGK